MRGLLGDLNIFSKIDIKRLEKVLLVNFLSNKIIIDYFLIKKIEVNNIIYISSGAALKPKYAWGVIVFQKQQQK